MEFYGIDAINGIKTNTISTLDGTFTINTVDLSGGGGSDYSLPIASLSTLGGIKLGDDLTIDTGGSVSVVNDSHTHDTRYYTEAEIDNMLSSLEISGGTSTDDIYYVNPSPSASDQALLQDDNTLQDLVYEIGTDSATICFKYYSSVLENGVTPYKFYNYCVVPSNISIVIEDDVVLQFYVDTENNEKGALIHGGEIEFPEAQVFEDFTTFSDAVWLKQVSELNPKYWGADPSGTTDSSGSLTSCINAFSGFTKESNLYIDAGDFLFENSVSLKSNLNIIGEGTGTQLISNIPSDSVSTAILYGKGVSYTNLHDVSVYCTDETLSAIKFKDSTQCEIYNITADQCESAVRISGGSYMKLYNFSGNEYCTNLIKIYNAAYNIDIKDIYHSNSLSYVISLEDDTDSETWDSQEIITTGDYIKGIVDPVYSFVALNDGTTGTTEPNWSDYYDEENTVTDGTVEWRVDTLLGKPQNINIENVILDDCNGGIEILNSDYVNCQKVTGTDFSLETPLIYISSSNHCTLKDIKGENCTQEYLIKASGCEYLNINNLSGYYIAGLLRIYAGYYITIDNLFCSDWGVDETYQERCLRLQGLQYANISNVTLINGTDNGIRLQTDDDTLEICKFVTLNNINIQNITATDAIRVYDSYNVVINNFIEQGCVAGVLVNGSTNVVVGSSCICFDGLDDDGGNTNLVDNTPTNTWTTI